MGDWSDWQASWDRQQGLYLPDREERFAAMLDAVEAVVGPEPTVLDLAAGPASITTRLLRQLPQAQVVALDLDPALLAIARGVFADDPRVRIIEADLASSQWAESLTGQQFDAVLTATALHWLPEARLAALYTELSQLIRRDGIFCNVDHMPAGKSNTIAASVRELRRRRRADRPNGMLGWEEWWETAAAHPRLSRLVRQRDAIFGSRGSALGSIGHHPAALEVFAPLPSWHLDKLRLAGFKEVSVTWQSYDAVMIAALR